MSANGLTSQPCQDAVLESRLRQSTLPRHVAIIMDGNGRWASERGLPRMAGHREGVESVREAVTLCRDLGISALTLYAFSMENWKRPQAEISFLMELFRECFRNHREQFVREGIRFKAIGRLELLPKAVQTMIGELIDASCGADRLTVTFALSYGARDEIVSAVNRVVQDAVRGRVGEAPMNESAFAQYLSTAELPDPDLVIRTSGESRVSNFLLWQIAYSELYFTRTLWPDFRRRDFLLALLDYQNRERRLGGLSLPSGSYAPRCALAPDSGQVGLCTDELTQTTSVFDGKPRQAAVGAQKNDSPSLLSSWLD